VRSMVGVIPLFTALLLDDDGIDRLPGLRQRMDWFLQHRADQVSNITYLEQGSVMENGSNTLRLLAIPTRARMERLLSYVLDENEFLSPYGVRSLSKIHEEQPFVFHTDGQEHRVAYVPGDSDSWMFGGNSNWRGPVWFPLNYLLIESLERFHKFYGDTFQVECPTGSGVMMNLDQVAQDLMKRLVRLFLRNQNGDRPCHGEDELYRENPHWQQYPLFYEYFHGETGRGLGASHQTGWTSLVNNMIQKLHKRGVTVEA
jgi:hypothetical protein